MDYSLIHDSAELRRLIAEHPELPIVVMCDSESVSDDYAYTYMSDVKCEIKEILDCETPYADYVFDDREDFKERIAEFICDEGECEHLSDEEFSKFVDEKASAYDSDWKKAIVICAGN